jgi:flagellar assembly protein FliH
MGAAPATRFTFDLDLTRNQEHAQFMSDAARAALQQQARAEGFAEGVAAGEKSTTAAAAQALATAAATIGERAAKLLAGLDATRGATERDAVALARSVGRKLAAALIGQQPAAELETLLAECLASLAGVPHLVIRCHPDLADTVRDLAQARIATSGFSGRLIVLGEPDIAPGDGRIEWADGGLVRDGSAISADIDRRIAAYLAARGLAPLEETLS